MSPRDVIWFGVPPCCDCHQNLYLLTFSPLTWPSICAYIIDTFTTNLQYLVLILFFLYGILKLFYCTGWWNICQSAKCACVFVPMVCVHFCVSVSTAAMSKNPVRRSKRSGLDQICVPLKLTSPNSRAVRMPALAPLSVSTHHQRQIWATSVGQHEPALTMRVLFIFFFDAFMSLCIN